MVYTKIMRDFWPGKISSLNPYIFPVSISIAIFSFKGDDIALNPILGDDMVT